MIDIHTHILPYIDDGASSLEESVALLDELKRQGVDTAVFTPHYYGRTRSVADFLRTREEAFEKLTIAYQGDVRLVKGCECNIATCVNADLNDLKPLRIGDTNYILLEMSFDNDWTEGLWKRIKKLVNLGLKPIIAHVELYPAVLKKPVYAANLIEMGCLLQLDCESLWNKKYSGLAKALLKHNQIHCLGSDAHNAITRPPYYIQAVKEIVNTVGQECVDILQMNMKKILDNQNVTAFLTDPVKKTFLGYV